MTNNAAEMVVDRIPAVNYELETLGAPFTVHFMSSVKPNLGQIFGFATRPRFDDGMIHPVIYWDQDQFSDLSDRQLAVRIIHKYLDESREMGPDLPDILSKDYILTTVLPKVLGVDENLHAIQGNGIPYELLPGTDLMSVFYFPVKQAGGTVQITEQIMDLTGITEADLVEAAKKNVLQQMTIQPLSKLMAEMAGMTYDEEAENISGFLPLYVASVRSNTFGAGILAAGSEALNRMAEAAKSEEIYILPSSLHEVLVLGCDSHSFEELLDMVTEVNAAVVEPADRLTDNVYHYSTKTGKILHCK